MKTPLLKFIVFSVLSILAVNIYAQSQPMKPEMIVDELLLPPDSIPAQYPGGYDELYKFLQNNFKFPERTGVWGYSGMVIVSFTIEEDGSASNFKLEKELVDWLDEEVLRVVKMIPKWIPAQKNGKNIRSKFMVPVKFDISTQR